jgi:MtaA/CmuA family methyltransferase
MNSLERYLAVLRGGVPDFVPRTPILMRFAAEHIGSHYGAFASDYRTLVQANAACAEDFGIDQLSCISDPYREAEGFGAHITYVRDGVPRATAPLADSKDLSRLGRPNALTSVRMRDRVEAVRAYRSQYGGQYSILGWVEGPAAEAADLRGVTAFLVDLLKDPAFAAELMDLCVDVAIEFARVQVDAGADTVGIGDAIASQVSPRIYEELIQPREKRLISAIRQLGALVKLHICGNITHLLPGIAGLGVDILDVDHMVDLATVRAQVGPRVALTGNIDPAEGVLRGNPAAIRQTVAAAYHEAGNPYLVNAGCEIPSGTPPENVRALCEPLPYRPG